MSRFQKGMTPWNKASLTDEERRERRRAWNRKADAKRSEKKRAYNRKYWAKNKGTLLPKVKAYADSHREELRAYWRAYDKNRADTARAYKLLKNSGWRLDEYEAALRAQGGKCAICRTKLKLSGAHTTDRAHADHDHTSGQPRAILCSACNKGLGYFKDNPGLLREAALYLESDHSDLRRVIPPSEDAAAQ